MLDIVRVEDGFDLGFADSAVTKAGNVISTQVGSLEYAPTFGVDLKYFLESDFQVPNSSFKAYLTQKLVQHQVNVSQCTETVEALFEKLTFFVDDPNKNSKGLLA